MEDKLRMLFDLQRFVRDDKLQEVIDRVEARCRCVALSDEELDNVAAAGTPYILQQLKSTNNN